MIIPLGLFFGHVTFDLENLAHFRISRPNKHSSVHPFERQLF
jgi:hypothetical protein